MLYHALLCFVVAYVLLYSNCPQITSEHRWRLMAPASDTTSGKKGPYPKIAQGSWFSRNQTSSVDGTFNIFESRSFLHVSSYFLVLNIQVTQSHQLVLNPIIFTNDLYKNKWSKEHPIHQSVPGNPMEPWPKAGTSRMTSAAGGRRSEETKFTMTCDLRDSSSQYNQHSMNLRVF